MSPKRRASILASLAAGNVILRYWKGANRGWLSHNLKGVKNLRESECQELQREGLLRYETTTEGELRRGSRGMAGRFTALVPTYLVQLETRHE
jgi:hypothetical protein